MPLAGAVQFGNDNRVPRLRVFAHQEGTGEYLDDTVIPTKVKAAIVASPA